MKSNRTYRIFTFLIAAVWIANGLFCKVLNIVSRHQQIVARILGDENSRTFTLLIGISEILMAIWIISGIKSKWNAIAQMTIIGTMNTMEFILAPDLLLWKKLNALWAFLFICFIGYNEFVLNRKKIQA